MKLFLQFKRPPQEILNGSYRYKHTVQTQSLTSIRLHGSYLSLGVRLCCVLQQELSNFTVSCSGGHVEGSLHFLA